MDVQINRQDIENIAARIDADPTLTDRERETLAAVFGLAGIALRGEDADVQGFAVNSAPQAPLTFSLSSSTPGSISLTRAFTDSRTGGEPNSIWNFHVWNVEV